VGSAGVVQRPSGRSNTEEKNLNSIKVHASQANHQVASVTGQGKKPSRACGGRPANKRRSYILEYLKKTTHAGLFFKKIGKGDTRGAASRKNHAEQVDVSTVENRAKE